MEIRKCKKEEIRELMNFINNFWSEGHILSKNKELIDWQYFNEEENNYNFIIAKDNGKMVGILGYIPNYRYDIKFKKNNSLLWLALWKVIDEAKYNGLGLKLLYHLEDIEKTDNIRVLGINNKVKQIYKLLGYSVGKLDHHYMINNYIEDYKIIENPIKNKNIVLLEDQCNIQKTLLSKDVLINNIDFMDKSIEYMRNKYIKNPYYNYFAYKVVDNKEVKLILIIKKVVIKSSIKILRIIDLIGNVSMMSNLNIAFQNLLKEHNAEYIDIYSMGIDRNILKKCGFILNDGSDNIIPNYFEPFEYKNIDLNYAIKSKTDRILILKGDGDQERPNIL